VPVMRPMFMEFPDDPGCRFLDKQFMLGRSLLIAPVFNADGLVTFYLPDGRWTNYRTGDVVDGGRWLSETHDFFSLPLYVRENTILPTGPVNQAPLRDSLTDLIITLYSIKTASRAVLFEGREIGIQAKKEKAGIQVELTEKIPGLVVRVSGIKQSWQCREKTIFIKTGTIRQIEE
jgi:alpha-D-xyloside xylohydrolase